MIRLKKSLGLRGSLKHIKLIVTCFRIVEILASRHNPVDVGVAEPRYIHSLNNFHFYLTKFF